MKQLLAFLTIIPLTFFGQQTDTIKEKKLAIGFTFSPDYCYRTLSTDDFSQWLADYRDGHEIPKLGYTAGLNLNLKMSKRISLEAGLLYSIKGEKTKQISIAPISEEIDQNTPIYVSYNYHYTYIDIPIKANYYLLTKKTKLFLTAGISTNIFLFQNTRQILEYIDWDKERKSQISSSDLTRLNLAFIGGFGFSRDLSDKLYLTIAPTFRYSLTSIVDLPIKQYLYSVGLNMGVYLKL